MDHYSWVATAAMLVSAITVPIVGKLSDLYGRRGFYLAGLVVFMVGSVVCGFAGSFWVLVARPRDPGPGHGHAHAAVADDHRRHHPGRVSAASTRA